MIENSGKKWIQKSENSQPQIENSDRENKIKINEIKQNIIKVTNTDMKDRKLKKKSFLIAKNNQTQIK